MVDLPNSWRARDYQLPLWRYMRSGGKRAIMIAHRRWGKDDVALHWTCISAMKKVACYWHMLPEYTQARKAIWNAVNPATGIRRIDEAFPKELRASTNEQEMFIRFINGSTWQVVGSDSYKSLVGTPPYGIVISEWSKANPYSWAYLSPILEENGGWAMFITTPEGKNHAHSLYKRAKSDSAWFADLQTVEDTGFPMERVEAARKDYHALYGIDAGDALIEQEYYCSFEAAVLGAVYGKEMARMVKEGRISDRVAHDPAYPVYTAFDLGWSDATAIWFFQIGRNEIIVIDYFESSFLQPREICEILYGRKINTKYINPETNEVEEWEFGDWIPEHEHRKDYNYHDMHYVPHDAGNKLQASGGRSIVEQCHEYGIRMSVIPAATDSTRQSALRVTLDRSWMQETRCAKGIEALQAYHREFDENTKDFKPKPKHDWSSHGTNAAELMARVWREKMVTIKEITDKRNAADFLRKRAKYNVDRTDPYGTSY